MSNPTWTDVMKFSLKESPIIFDVGGYKGDWAKIAMDNYANTEIYIFEPVKKFYNEIVDRYKGNDKIRVYNFGLSSQNSIEKISSSGDGSSIFLPGGEEEIILKDIREFLFEEKIFNVDLIKINIEGEEYRLLKHLIQFPELNVFQNYLIQFHTFIEEYEEKRSEIVKELAVYYDRIFNYEMIFEGWSMKKIQRVNCIGDSHISIFSNSETLIKENVVFENDNFYSYRFGPYLAYNLEEKPNVTSVANSFNTNENLLVAFGEIDCRAQVHRFIDANNDYKKVIDNTVERYFNTLGKFNNKNIIVFSIAPELKEQPHWYYYKDHPQVFDCPKGTYAERRKYKEYYNLRIKEEAQKNGYKFISIYEHLVNEFSTKDVYYLDDIHLLSKNVYYLIKREFIKNNFIVL